MSLRITQDVLFRNSLVYMQKGLRHVEEAQGPLLTGKRINRPSDDPFGTVRVLKLREERKSLENFSSNIQMVMGWQESSATALQSVSTLIASVKATSVQGASSGYNQNDRDTLASQIDQQLTEAISLANSHFGGRYLFGGTNISSIPYTYDGSSNVTYSGNNKINSAWISEGTKIASNIPGSNIFNKMKRDATTYTGNTGAAAGSGTDSGVGNDTLLVTHGITSYAGITGVAAGASSAAQDSVIGAAGTHSLTITTATATTGTVSLNGGPPIAYDTTAPGAADFQVTDSNGENVFVDLTAAPLVTGVDSITSTGFLSLDGGASTSAIDFSSSQLIEDTATGKFTHINSSGITSAGSEYLSYSGTFSLFDVLIGIRDDLKNTRGLSENDQLKSISSRIAELDNVHENALSALTEFGGRSLRLEMTQTRLDDFDIKLQGIVAETEETDMTEAIMYLEMANQSLQLAQAVTGQILNSTLLNKYQ